MLLAATLAGLLPARGWGEEARAATGVPPPGQVTVPNPDSFLGALSFSSSRAPVSVSADHLEFDYRARVLTYTGNVVATQGDMKLESHRLTVTLDGQVQNQVKEVVAQGQVRLSQGTRWATGGRAVFDQAHGTVVLSDHAVMHDGPNQLSGDRVVVYLNQERSVVEGGSGRVQAVLYPPTPAATGAPR